MRYGEAIPKRILLYDCDMRNGVSSQFIVNLLNTIISREVKLYMENELEILRNIEKNKYATQREIAKNTGLSLGNVNILIKRLVKKGLVKIERLNTRNIKYILTPQGIKEQAEASYNYIKLSYRYIENANRRIDSFISSEYFNTIENIILLGEMDEIYEMFSNRLKQVKKIYVHAKSFNEIDNNFLQTIISQDIKKYCIVVWHPNFQEELVQKNIDFIYLLDII